MGPSTGWQSISAILGNPSLFQAGAYSAASISNSLFSVQLPPVFPGYALFDNINPSNQRQLYLQVGDAGTYATTQNVAISRLLSAALQGLSEVPDRLTTVVSTQAMQPYVSVACNFNAVMGANDSRPIMFPVSPVTSVSSANKAEPTLEVEPFPGITRVHFWNLAQSDQQGTITWIDPTETNVSNASIRVLILRPQPCVFDGSANDFSASGENATAAQSYLTASACLINAVWSNTTSNATVIHPERNTQNSIYSAISNYFPASSIADSADWSGPVVRLSRDWTAYLNPTTSVGNSTVADVLIQEMHELQDDCPSATKYLGSLANAPTEQLRLYGHEAMLAALVANGMAYAGVRAEPWYLFKTTSGSKWAPSFEPEPCVGWDDVSNCTRLSAPPGIVIQIQGYYPGLAYSLEGFPVKIAIAVLILYCIYVTLYICYILGTGHSSHSWGSLSDVMTLALESPPIKTIRHAKTSTQFATLKKPVCIRGAGNTERYEIVFADEDKAERMT